MFENAWRGMGVTTQSVVTWLYLQSMMIIVLRSADCLVCRYLLVMLTMVGAVCACFCPLQLQRSEGGHSDVFGHWVA
jgi:hypothetical protein